MMKALAVAACVLCVTYSGVAAAGPVDEVRGGVYLQGCCGFGSDKEDGAALNGEVLFNSPRFLSVVGAPRPLIGATVATDGDATSQVYSGLEWKINISRWFVAAGGGVAVHNGETDTFDPVADAARASETVFFGCRVVFRIAGDAGYRITDRINASFHWNHISNGELCRNNEGLDQMGFRIGVSL